MAEKKKNKPGQGRKSSYLPEYARIAEQYFKEGKLNKDLENLLGVSENTLTNWRNEYPEFNKAYEAKAVPNAIVEKSLYKRAKGMVIWEEKLDKDGNIIKLKRQIPPCDRSASKWLNNRDPLRWRDKQEIEHVGLPTPVINVITKK